MINLLIELQNLTSEYEVFRQTEEAIHEFERYKTEINEVNSIVKKLEKLDPNSREFEDWVLYGLLPHKKTSVALRVSRYPIFFDIRKYFMKYRYTDHDWNIIARIVYDLCVKFKENPSNLATLIDTFVNNKFSKGLQVAGITPLLFCLNQKFPVSNGRVRNTFDKLNNLINPDSKDKLSDKLSFYPRDVDRINNLITKLNYEPLNDKVEFDLFCYWFDAIYSSDKGDIRKDSEGNQTAEEIERELKFSEFQVQDLFEDQDLQSISEYTPHKLNPPQRIVINQIISRIENTEWMLPYFQRYFDWNKTNVKDLWESIFRDYYVGSFLLWESQGSPKLGVQPIKGVNHREGSTNPQAIILDGQQRMTSLFYAIHPPKFKLKGSKEILYFYANFYSFFNNEDYEIIETRTKKLSREDSLNLMLFPLYELDKFSQWVKDFKNFLKQELKKSNSNDRETILEKIDKIRDFTQDKLNHIWNDFEIPFINLPKDLELFQVTDIFEKLNSKGKPLNVFDLLIARLYKEKIELKSLWDENLRIYPNISRYYNKINKLPIYTLQSMSLLYQKNSSAKRKDILNIYKNVYYSSQRNFVDDWNEITEYQDRAILKIENMKDGFGVFNEGELPYGPVIPVLTSLLKIIDSEQDKVDCYNKLNNWYWSAIFTSAYSSASDTQMTNDFKEMRTWFSDRDKIPYVIQRARKEFRLIDFKKIQTKSNVLYRGIMSLIAKAGALDFDTAQSIRNEKENDKDHIFPKKYAKEYGIKSIINSILNMTWISKSTNRKSKWSKKPSIYFKELIKEKYSDNEKRFLEITNTHLVDQGALNYLKTDRFMEFLEEREKYILQVIAKNIGLDESSDNITLISDKTPFSNQLIISDTIKSCEGYIYWIDKYYSAIGFEELIKAVDPRLINEIKIISSNKKIDSKFRKLFKRFRTEMENKNIKCDFRVMLDSKVLRSVHDRFLISKYKAYNFVSLDTIKIGQLSEILESTNRDALYEEFNRIWDLSLDLINDWDKIFNSNLN